MILSTRIFTVFGNSKTLLKLPYFFAPGIIRRVDINALYFFTVAVAQQFYYFQVFAFNN